MYQNVLLGWVDGLSQTRSIPRSPEGDNNGSFVKEKVLWVLNHQCLYHIQVLLVDPIIGKGKNRWKFVETFSH